MRTLGRSGGGLAFQQQIRTCVDEAVLVPEVVIDGLAVIEEVKVAVSEAVILPVAVLVRLLLGVCVSLAEGVAVCRDRGATSTTGRRRGVTGHNGGSGEGSQRRWREGSWSVGAGDCAGHQWLGTVINRAIHAGGWSGLIPCRRSQPACEGSRHTRGHATSNVAAAEPGS
jgi:hypothetical protein